MLKIIKGYIYEYSLFNGATQVENRPIGTTWEISYEHVTKYQDFLKKLERDIIESDLLTDKEHEDLHNLISGDVCQTIYSSQSNASHLHNGVDLKK